MLKEVKIEVTNLCYRNCKHCSSEATCDDNSHLFLDGALVKDIINQAYAMGANSIAFTGGEATLYPALSEVVAYAKGLGLTTKLYSLCYRTEDNVELLKNLNAIGLDEIIYSTATSLITSDELSTYSIEDFVGIIAKETNLSIGFHHVVTSETIECIKDLSTYIEAAGQNFSKLSFLRYVPHGRGDISLIPSDEQMEKYKELLSNLQNKYGRGIRLGSPFNILSSTNTPCDAAEGTMIIGFDGMVYPCDAMKYFDYMGSGGNIYKQSIKEMYESPYFENIRIFKDFHNEDCDICHNYKICKGGCLGQKMIYATSIDGIKTLEWFELNAKRTMGPFSAMPELTRENAGLGIAGETGILINYIKQLLILIHDRDEKGQAYLKKMMILKIGDIIWYVAASLSKGYDISFDEIGGQVIKSPNSKTKVIDQNIIKQCAILKDPNCPFTTMPRSHAIAELDALFTRNVSNFDLTTFWKKLLVVSTDLSLSQEREKIIVLASKLLITLGEFGHYYLGITLEDALTKNVLKLQRRYSKGFDSKQIGNKIEKEAMTKLLDSKEELSRTKK